MHADDPTRTAWRWTQRFSRSGRGPERTGRRGESIASRHIVVAFLITLVALAWLFERSTFWRQAVLGADAGAASLAYLRAMIDADPTDVELRLKLARALTDARDWEQAYAAIAPLLGTSDRVDMQVWLQQLRIRQAELYHLPAKSPRRGDLQRALLADLTRLTRTPGAAEQLEAVAKIALEVEQPRLGAEAYEQLARTRKGAEAAGWLREAGRWYLAAGEPMRAAGVLHEAVAQASSPEAAEALALAELDALKAAPADQRGQRALDICRLYVERFAQSRPFLEAAIATARSESAAEDAYAWGELRLALDPDDPVWLSRLRSMALDAGHMEDALRLTHRMVALDPSSPESRERLAETAEWASQPAVALPNWLWLATQDPSGPGITRGLALARGLRNDQALMRLLELAATRRTLEQGEIEELTQASIRASALKSGIETLTRYLSQHPGAIPAWRALAELRERAKDIAGAVQAWREVAKAPDERLFATLRSADLLWRSGKRDAAWGVLTALKPPPDSKRLDYWRVVADQAWELEHLNEAKAAYRTLWSAGSADLVVAERLILLTAKGKREGETIALAESAYRSLREPRLLLLGVDAALRARRFDDLRRLLAIADQAPGRFPPLASYWLQLGALEQEQGRTAAAKNAYERALALDPKSNPVRAALLWLAIDSNDDQQLRLLLDRWSDEALASPALWQPYALGHSKLGETAKALPWLERRLEDEPQDSNALLDYADALTKTGQGGRALELRKAAFQELRKKLAAAPR